MTFSIAGRCSETGAFGCALATSSIAAAARCPFGSKDAGIVLTQARTDPRLGLAGLELLRSGLDADGVVAKLVADHADTSWRQLAVLDLKGGLAAHTGQDVSPPKGAETAAHSVAIGNWVTSPSVVEAMVAAFEQGQGSPLADRLIGALEAAQAAGGELDPLRSSGVLIYGDQAFAEIDLRIDSSDTPIRDLRGLWQQYQPVMDGYIERALDPANAPDTEDLEGHR